MHPLSYELVFALSNAGSSLDRCPRRTVEGVGARARGLVGAAVWRPVVVSSIAVAVVGSVVALGSCADPRLDRGRIDGTVLAGPTCPVEVEGQTCPPRPVAGEVLATQRGEVKARARTDPSGHYALILPAGTYVLRVDVGGALPTCPDATVVVQVAAAASADINCDTGIR
jgi:hypothetical protein